MEARHDLLTRSFSVRVRDETGTEEKPEMWVEGYAVRFESPTVLFEYDGTEYKEQIDRNAFEECQMEDVIFNYNHGGKVMARTRKDAVFGDQIGWSVYSGASGWNGRGKAAV